MTGPRNQQPVAARKLRRSNHVCHWSALLHALKNNFGLRPQRPHRPHNFSEIAEGVAKMKANLFVQQASLGRLSENPQDSFHPDRHIPIIRSDGPKRMLRLRRVLDITGLGKTTIYQLQADGDFPKRVQLTAHSVAWVEEEVLAWLARRAEVR
jgi:prophage regulatory protein